MPGSDPPRAPRAAARAWRRGRRTHRARPPALAAAVLAAVTVPALSAAAALARAEAPSPPPRIVYGAAEDFAPYEYRGEDGAPRGFNIALLRALAEEAGTQVEFRLGPWPAMLDRFARGEVDIVSLRGTEERAARYDVLERTWTITVGLAYRVGTAPAAGVAPPLAGQVIAVKRYSWLAQRLEQLPEAERPVLLLTESRAQALLQLRRGYPRAAAGDELALRWDAYRLGLGDLEYRPIASHPYHLVVRKGEAAAYGWVAPALAQLRQRGVIDHLAETELVIPPTQAAWLRYLGPLFASGLLALAVAIAFGVALQRQVRVRTRQLARLLAEKEQLARSLARSESRLRGILDEQSELICRWRPGGTLSYVNEAYRRLFGLEREALAERHFLSDVPPEWHAAAEQELVGLGVARPTATIELPVRLGSGWRWMQWAVRAIFDDAGGVGELQAVGRDVTERRAAEEALRRSEERLEMAMRTVGLGLWEWHVQADRVEIDAEWASRLGLEARQVPAARLRERVHPEDWPRVERVLSAHLDDGAPSYAAELRVRAATGEWLWLLHHGKLIEHDAAGRPLRLLGVHLDVTEHKRVEERLSRAERLAALGTFAAGIAHELNNPIGAIHLAAEYARSRVDAEAAGAELAATLDDIVEEARRCGEIVRGVLRLAAAAPPRREPTELGAVARAALEQTRAEAAVQGTSIELALDPALGLVEVSPADIRQLLANLLRNAVQAAGGGGRVRLSVEATPAGVRFVVEDDGPGLSEEQCRRAFDPFYTTRRAQGGTGLGLSLCHALVSAHGGTIALASPEGGGARVTVELPRGAPAAALAGRVEAAAGREWRA